MISSKFTENGPANSGTGLPSSDKQQPVKTALRDLQNNNRILAPKSPGKSSLVKDRVPLTGEALVSGIKRPATESLQKSKCNQAPTSSGANGPLVYARRKCEQELPPKSNELSKDRKIDYAREDQQEKEKPQQQAQSESTKKSSLSTISTSAKMTSLPESNEFERYKKRAREDQEEKDKPQHQAESKWTKKSCISGISETSAIATLLPKSNESEKDKKHAREDQEEKDKPQQQAQSKWTRKSNLSAISATSPMVTLPHKSDELEKKKSIDSEQKDQQELGKPQQQVQSESTKKACVSAISVTSPMVTLPPKSNELEKKKNIDCGQKDQQDQGEPQQHVQSESTKKACVSAISVTSPMLTLPPKSNELEKEKNNDSWQKNQQEQGKPQQQVQGESTKKACVSAISATSPMVTLPAKSSEFEEKDINSAQKDQQELGKPQRQAQRETTKKACVSAISAASPMLTLPPESNEFEKEKNTDSAQKDQQEQGKPQRQAQSETTKKACVSAISAASPMVTLPPKTNEFEKERDIDSVQKDQREHGKHQLQAQSESTKKSCVAAISASSPVVTSGGSSSFPAKPLNENSCEKNNGTNTSEVSHSGKSEGVNDQHWKERSVQLQAHLRNCDQSRNLETITKLQTLTPVGRSKYAVELEKRAIQLLLEEGNELMRMKELNVLGKPVAKNSAPPSTKQLQTEN